MNATFGAMVGKRIVVAITGASGAIYGIRTLEILRERSDTETHLVISDSGRATIAQETRRSIEEVRSLADVVHPFRELGASIPSRSSARPTVWSTSASIEAGSA